MQTAVISAESPDFPDLAVEFLQQGLPVAVPSETVYGLAADALRADAVAHIFEAKERPFFDPLIVHLPDRSWLEQVARVPDESAALIARLADAFWPGPLTLVLPRHPIVPDLTCSGLPTVAVRIPANPVFQKILHHFGKPLAAPSANRFGRISPTAASHVFEELNTRIPLIVDGGDTQHGVESTILRIADGWIEILRHGPIDEETLRAFAPVRAASRRTDTDRPSAPGRLDSHYAPATPLLLATDPVPIPGKKCGLLTAMHSGKGFEKVEQLSLDPRVAATKLFAALRRLDAAQLDIILAQRFPNHGLGRAINDRLERAGKNSE